MKNKYFTVKMFCKNFEGHTYEQRSKFSNGEEMTFTKIDDALSYANGKIEKAKMHVGNAFSYIIEEHSLKKEK